MKPSNEKPNRFPILRERLNLLMRDMDLTTTDFANRVGITRQTMGFYLNGDRIPDSLTIAQICKKCEVSANWLLGLTDIRSPDVGIEAIVQYTGLSEENINYLHNELAERIKRPYSQWGPTLFVLIDKLIKLSNVDVVNESFFNLKKIHEEFQRNTARNSGIDQEVANWIVHKRGYTAVSPNDAICFFAHRISQTIERLIVEEYAVTQTSEPYGRKETAEINGMKIPLSCE